MQELKELYMFLREDSELKEYIGELEKLTPVFLQKTPEEFAVSQEKDFLFDELDKLKFERLESILSRIPNVPHITAYILKACEAFTIAFLIIPAHTIFDWHDHQLMNGISRCVYGGLTIRSLNPDYLRKAEKEGEESAHELNTPMEVGEVFHYPMDRVREEKLDAKENRVSLIYPDSYNIHEIRSSPYQQSAFIDLLVPEYPDDSCHFFESVEASEEEDSEEVLKIRKIKEGRAKVIGFDTLIKYIREKSLTNKAKCPQVIIPPCPK